MKQNSTKSPNNFSRGLLGYIMVYLFFAAIGLVVFTMYLYAYEYTLTENTLNRYLNNMDEAEFETLIAPTLSELNNGLKSDEESAAYIRNRLDNVTFIKKSDERTANPLTFVLHSEGKDIGSVVLSNSGEKMLGFRLWQVSSFTLDFRSEYKSFEVAIPPEYILLLGGKEPQVVSEEAQEYERLKDFYADGVNLPMLIHYVSGYYLGDDELQISTPDGTPLSADNLNETFFLNNCNENELQTLTAFANGFVDKYVAFTSNRDYDRYGNYWVLMQYVANGSDFQQRMEQAIGSLAFTRNYGTDILSTSVDLACALGDGGYFMEVSYQLQIGGINGELTTTDNNLRLLLIPAENGLLVTKLEIF